jgi:predicted lipoprotein with Yx(FWY)xxD motif
MIHWRVRAAALGCIALAVLALSACSSSKSKVSSNTTTAATASTVVPATAGPLVKVATVPKVGEVLVDARGYTLYHLTKETPSHLVCTGGCTSIWPPLLVPAGVATPTGGPGVTGTLTTVTRPDGGIQVTYDSLPLYLYSKDTAPGQANGEGVAGVWFAVKVSGQSAGAAGATTATTAASKSVATTAVAPEATVEPTTARATASTAAPASTTPPRSTPPPTYPPTTKGPCVYPPCY